MQINKITLDKAGVKNGEKRINFIYTSSNWSEISSFVKVAIIGSRAVSEYAKIALERLLPGLINAQVVPVALVGAGLGEVVHQQVAKLDGYSVGVVGSALDVPPSNYDALLIDQIMKAGGALVSALPPGKSARRWTFTLTNQLLVALSDLLIVIEARENSNCLAMAKLASSWGRSIWAVPGRITDPAAVGSNYLLATNIAKPLISSVQILEHLNLSLDDIQKNRKVIFSHLEQKVVECIKKNHCSIDEIALITGLSIGELQQVVTGLVLRGIVKESAGRLGIVVG